LTKKKILTPELLQRPQTKKFSERYLWQTSALLNAAGMIQIHEDN